MIQHFFILLCALALSFKLQATEKTDSFIQLADQLARLELQYDRTTSNWTMVTPLFLSKNTHQELSLVLEKINTPAKYYAQSKSVRKNFKKLNAKVQHLEGFFSEKEYDDLVKRIHLKKLELQNNKKDFSIVDAKKAVTDFHLRKLDILPSAIDTLLGLDYESVEDRLNKADYPVWDADIGMNKERSQSDYADLRKIFQYLQLTEKDIFYDLGSGYGRVGFYGGILNPNVSFKGIELVSERALQAQTIASALDLKNVKFIAGDVLKENFDDGTVFYMFNPFPSIMGEVIPKLRNIAAKRRIKIVAMGYTVDQLQNLDWLEVEKSLSPERDYNPLIVYKSKL